MGPSTAVPTRRAEWAALIRDSVPREQNPSPQAPKPRAACRHGVRNPRHPDGCLRPGSLVWLG